MKAENEPLIPQRADPYIYKHTDGYYYFTASVPQYDRIELRRAKSIAELQSAQTKDIWIKHNTGIMGAHIWAPELHFIDGKWYIYFAAGEVENIWNIRPFVLECADENPLEGTWIEKGIMQRADGDDLSFTTFSLDATTFTHNSERYFIWAQITEPGSCLYIAKMENPWTLSTPATLLTQPDQPWEKIGHKVNEGAAVIKNSGKIFVSYSASATDHNYCMGLLWINEEDDLLIKENWHKLDKPVMTTDEANLCFGPGHNSFTKSEDGREDILVYHARPYKDLISEPLYDPNRHTYVKTLKWNEDGFPVFQ